MIDSHFRTCPWYYEVKMDGTDPNELLKDANVPKNDHEEGCDSNTRGIFQYAACMLATLGSSS